MEENISVTIIETIFGSYYTFTFSLHLSNSSFKLKKCLSKTEIGMTLVSLRKFGKSSRIKTLQKWISHVGIFWNLWQSKTKSKFALLIVPLCKAKLYCTTGLKFQRFSTHKSVELALLGPSNSRLTVKTGDYPKYAIFLSNY